eukprot:1149498-Pelagomonas_calceolata.AAC.6
MPRIKGKWKCLLSASSAHQRQSAEECEYACVTCMEGAQQALHAANREAQDISSRLLSSMLAYGGKGSVFA